MKEPGLEPTVESTDAGATTAPPDAEQAFWRTLREARNREDFCRAWLSLQVRLVEGTRLGLVVLGPPDKGPYAPVASWPEGRPELRTLAEAAERSLVKRQGLILKRGAEDTHVAWPVRLRGSLCGVVVLEVSRRDEGGLQAALRSLQWGAAWLEVLLRREEAETSGESGESLQAVLDFVAAVVEREGFEAGATTLLTEIATRFACDRASMGLLHKDRIELFKLSHSATVAAKANLVRAMEASMEEACDQEQVIVSPALPGGGFQVTLAHERLARASGSGALCSVPLARQGEVFGALLLERPEERAFQSDEVALFETLCALVGPILDLERREERWFGAKLVETSRAQLKKLLQSGHTGFKVSVFTVLAVLLFLLFARTDHRVSAKSALEAEVQRAAIAPFNGYVVEAPLRAGDLVGADQTLCILDDGDLDLERGRLESQKHELEKEYDQALAARKAAEVKIAEARIAQIQAQLDLVLDQLARTTVTSPIDGFVVNGDLSQSIGSPVQRGQVLFEVAPLDSYRLILEVDERDIAHVQVGQTGEIRFTAFPTEPYSFEVTSITPVSVALEGRNFFRVEARLVAFDESLRPGMEGIGKITAGRRRIAWIWTHQAIDWVRLFLWKWMP